MQGSIVPDKNLVIAAAAAISAKACLLASTKLGVLIDVETQGYILVVATWLSAHIYDMISGDNNK